jgi:hypothetical protein
MKYHSALATFDTNYIISRNVEDFKKMFFEEHNFENENKESFQIFRTN